MPLSPGARLGPYEVLSSLGAGGMGEVYRARDAKLARDVAIKILPDAFAADADRLARFKREAQVLASLNHPNIAQIHGFEDSGGTHALVMELVDGTDLSAIIARGPIATADALGIATQIAHALEAAHESGIVHRDLKPANVKVKSDGTVKVLDFGLAKAIDDLGGRTFRSGGPAGSDHLRQGYGGPPKLHAEAEDPASYATKTSPAMTELGVILGTAAYMSPEQAKGRAVDKRADIWAFGVVLYEMLTGRALFGGDSVAETIGFVATRDPDWSALPAATPDRVRRLLARCLTRDSKHRLRDIGEARIALVAPDDAPVVSTSTRRERWLWIAGVVAGAGLAGVAVWLLRPAPAPVSNVVTRFSYQLPEGQSLGQWIALSPDGSQLAYIANRQIYLRAMDQLEAQPIAGSKENPWAFAFSPDGRWIAYFTGAIGRSGASVALKKIPVSGGLPEILTDGVVESYSLSWRGDTIVFADKRRGSSPAIYAVPASGGAARALVTLDSEKDIADEPQLLEDGRHVLMTYATAGDGEPSVVIQPLAGGPRKVLMKSARDARILPTGHLIYEMGRRLFAVSFDSSRLEVRGSPVTMIEGVRGYDVATNGTLVFVPRPVDEAPQLNILVWVDRKGVETPIAAKPRAYTYPRISPDGTRIVVDSRDEERDLWVWEIARETLSRLTFSKEDGEGYPIWTADSRHVIYRAAARDSDIHRRRADGTGAAEALTKGLEYASPHSLTPDGKQLVYRDTVGNGTRDLFVLPLAPPGAPKPLIQSGFQEENGELSPDGRWIAYESNESGAERNIYVRPFPVVDDGKWQVSSGGAWSPMWSRNSRELFYRSAKEFFVVDVAGGPAGGAFTFSKPRVLFPYTGYLFGATRTYDISPDGRRFLMVKTSTSQVPPLRLTVVSHWFEEVRARVTGR